jgi:hypothetical protein
VNLFLLTSTLEIAFYIDKKGRRVQKDWIIEWEGHPSSFAFFYPYVLAFDSSFIEIRHMNTVSIYIYIFLYNDTNIKSKNVG